MKKPRWISKRLPLRSDSDKGISIKNLLLFIISISSLVISLIPIVMAYRGLNERVNNLESIPLQIDSIEFRVNEIEKVAAGNDVLLQTIKEDINEIKLDLKELRQDLIDYFNPGGIT